MKRVIIMIFLVFGFLNASNTSTNDPYRAIEYFVLKNGLQVYFLSDSRATNTRISVTVNVGWDIEDEKSYGLSHLTEHIVFRDQRVPYHDYVDYIKEEGASYINAFTSRYTTQYLATIESKKSYWLAKTFAQMMFDKNVTHDDLEIERGALQVEIGETKWHDTIVSALLATRKIFPPTENIYSDHFGLIEPKDSPGFISAKRNNKRFSLSDVMNHYSDYYYPSNMTLKIAGNFKNSKMKRLIVDEFGKFDASGHKKTKRPPRNAKLNGKQYFRYHEGASSNRGYIGAKYLRDDCRKEIILDAFMEHIAKKLQQKLRNKQGKSYSVSAYTFGSRGAGITAISFDGLSEDFEKNILLVKQHLHHYIRHISDTEISDSLGEYKKRYTTIEHDSKSLMGLVNQAEHIRTTHGVTDKTHLDFFRSITHDDYRRIIQSTFLPQNNYSNITRSQYLFSGDIGIINLILTLIFFYGYFQYSRIILKLRGESYKKREVVFSRRLSNRFTGFLMFLLTLLVSSLLYAWLHYISMKYLAGNPWYLSTIDLPHSFWISGIDMIVSLLFFFVVYRVLIGYYSRLDVTQDKIMILGSKPRVIQKKEVVSISTEPWSPGKIFRIFGSFFFFWKPLLKLTTSDNSIYYIRADNAEELREDFAKKWLYE